MNNITTPIPMPSAINIPVILFSNISMSAKFLPSTTSPKKKSK